MKAFRPFLAIAGFLALVLVASCAKGAKVPRGPEGRADVEGALSRAGIAAIQGAPFYASPDGALGEGAKPEWKAALDFGTGLKLAGDARPRGFAVGGESIELVPVELSAAAGGPSGGWVRVSHYAGGGAERAAATAESLIVRSSPSPEGAVLARLPRMSLLAAIRGKDSGGFARAVVMDPLSGKPLGEAFVESAQLSFERADVESAILFARALAARDEESGRAILEDAERSYGGSAFIGDIRERLGAGEGGARDGPPLEAIATTLAAARDGVQILESPYAGAAILATLKLDETVEVVERTVEQDEVEGQKARWYRVSSPAEGWVFGLGLEGAD
jgi:hypothetical protein